MSSGGLDKVHGRIVRSETVLYGVPEDKAERLVDFIDLSLALPGLHVQDLLQLHRRDISDSFISYIF